MILGVKELNINCNDRFVNVISIQGFSPLAKMQITLSKQNMLVMCFAGVWNAFNIITIDCFSQNFANFSLLEKNTCLANLEEMCSAKIIRINQKQSFMEH